MMNNDELRAMVLQDLDLSDIPKEAQDQLVTQLGEIILQSVVMTILEQLLPGARAEFQEISASGDHDQIQSFLEENVPNVHTLIQEEVEKTVGMFKERSKIA